MVLQLIVLSVFMYVAGIVFSMGIIMHMTMTQHPEDHLEIRDEIKPVLMLWPIFVLWPQQLKEDFCFREAWLKTGSSTIPIVTFGLLGVGMTYPSSCLVALGFLVFWACLAQYHKHQTDLQARK